jgi:hypothetical protein
MLHILLHFLYLKKFPPSRLQRIFNMKNIGFGLGEVAFFTIPIAVGIDAENQCLIDLKCVSGALNRHFCQPPVSGCPCACRSLIVRCIAVSFRLERLTLLQA